MDHFIKEIGLITKKKAREFLNGVMDELIMETM